jgi:methylmalonyl-CoA mutase N-terminal domain/subunit
VSQASEQAQIERVQALRSSRDAAACERALAAVAAAARSDSLPLLEPLRAALAARCTVGEVCGALRSEWGTYDAQISHGL